MSPLADPVVARLRLLPTGIARFALVAAVLLLLVGWTTNWFPWDLDGHPSLESGAPVLLLAVVSAAPLVALRSVVAATLVGSSPFLLLGLGPVSVLPWVQYPALLATGVVVTAKHPARALVPFVASMAPVLGYVTDRWSLAVPAGGEVDASYGGSSVVELGIYLGFTVLSVVVAHAMSNSSAREVVREARAEEVEQESTIVAERARLAHDLHDVVAHHISLIAVRAETAPYVVPGLSAEATAMLADIAQDARRSLEELRHVLGVLRRAETDEPRAPLPTLVDLPALVDQVRAAGDVVAVAGLSAASGARAVSAAQSHVAYRVVQEALTNARRHAPQAPVSMAISADDSGTLDLTVTNPLPAGSSDEIVEGRGLVGIRERVEALGGTVGLEHHQGHHTLHVTLPGRRP